MNKEPCNLFGQKAYQTTSNQKIVSGATFHWWLFPCKKSKISLDSFQKYWCSTILQSDWTWGKTGHNQLKVVVSDATFPLWLRILQSDWTKGTTGLNQPKLLVLDASFPWWLTPCKKKSKISIGIFSRDTRDQRILHMTGQEAELGTPNQKL